MKLDSMKVFLICITFSAFVSTATYFSFSQTRRPLPPMENPNIVIRKKKRLLKIFDGEKLVRQYKIVLGFMARAYPGGSLEKLFDPFYCVESDRARQTGGTGLDLAIVKTCVEACQGTTSARNREPKGLAVTITLKS